MNLGCGSFCFPICQNLFRRPSRAAFIFARVPQPRVYVVDDEWIIAETLAAILTKNGFHALPFHNSSQAMVRAMDQPPDIVITDVMMPGMTGIELAIALRQAGHTAASCSSPVRQVRSICCATLGTADTISNF